MRGGLISECGIKSPGKYLVMPVGSLKRPRAASVDRESTGYTWVVQEGKSAAPPCPHLCASPARVLPVPTHDGH